MRFNKRLFKIRMTIGFSEYILTFQVKDFVVFSIKLDLW